MSKLSKLIRKVAPIAGALLPGVGGVVARGLGAAFGSGQAAAPPTTFDFGAGQAMFPAIGAGVGRALPAIGRALGPGLGGIVGVGARGVGTIARSAMTYCKRHPAWCASIGGVAAVEALVGNGSLPPIKRSRGRGISASDLRKFKRVARVIHRYCAPVRSAMRSPAMRRSKC